MKSKITPIVVLGVICLIVTLLLASVNAMTKNTIEKVQYQKEQQALREVMPKGERFTEVEVNGLPESITKVYKESTGGYIFRISTKGYSTGLVLLCGIDSNGKLTKIVSVVTNETPSKEAGISEKFDGMTSTNHSAVIVSGATKTSTAYSDAVKDAFTAYRMISKEGG